MAGRPGLADELLDLCSLALGLGPTDLRDRCRADDGPGVAQLVRAAWRRRPGPDQFRIGPHTDFGTLTILDREPGAAACRSSTSSGRGSTPPFVAGTLAHQHRRPDPPLDQRPVVLEPAPRPATAGDEPTEELISLVFFHEPDDDALIEAFPTCVSRRRPARHPPLIPPTTTGQDGRASPSDRTRQIASAWIPESAMRNTVRSALHSPMTSTPPAGTRRPPRRCRRRRSTGRGRRWRHRPSASTSPDGTAPRRATDPRDGDFSDWKVVMILDGSIDDGGWNTTHAPRRRQDRGGVPGDRGGLRREHRPRPDGDERVRGRRRRRGRHGDRHHLLPGRHDGRRR